MPRLRVLLLSDEALNFHLGIRFKFAELIDKHLVILKEWSDYCPTLRIAAFTSLFMWRKTSLGWVIDRKKGAGDVFRWGDQ